MQYQNSFLEMTKIVTVAANFQSLVYSFYLFIVSNKSVHFIYSIHSIHLQVIKAIVTTATTKNEDGGTGGYFMATQM